MLNLNHRKPGSNHRFTVGQDEAHALVCKVLKTPRSRPVFVKLGGAVAWWGGGYMFQSWLVFFPFFRLEYVAGGTNILAVEHPRLILGMYNK